MIACLQADIDRFWAKVDRRGPDDCWLWTAGTKGKYGYFSLGGRAGRMHLAPRVVWTIVHGPIPEGLHVLHHCDNPSCCNPRHLFLGTPLTNSRDKIAKGRHAHGVAHGAAKLTDQAVVEIRALADIGTSQREISYTFGVSQSVVSDIVNRKKWAHVA